MTGWRSLGILAAFAFLPFISLAQVQSIQVSKAFTSRQLAGVVSDPTVAPIADAKIEVCRPYWRDCCSSTMTDGKGQF